VSEIQPGFSDPVVMAQQSFRALLQAQAKPGTWHSLPRTEKISDLPGTLAAAALTLFDPETRIWGNFSQHALRYLRFHCSCPIATEPSEAEFIVWKAEEGLPPFSEMNSGTVIAPETGATLIMSVPQELEGHAVKLTGPGIQASKRFSPGGVSSIFWDSLVKTRTEALLGIDVIFCSPSRVAAVPRSTEPCL
jgi:alpha-D-ribose 1-methylphosphonate 5-triphosphate synthase subunit PhnH